MKFGARVPLLDGGRPALGYEPGLEIDSAGTVFVTAHKSVPLQAKGRLGSWLWRSSDGGRDFTSMVGPGASSATPYALEGDLAVDGKDRLYFADTYQADNHLYRYSDHGRTLDLYRPALGTAELDDRPWLAAHGDGFVYYLSTTAYAPRGRLTLHRSVDAGQSFDDPGFTFPLSGQGFLDADPRSNDVYVVTDDLLYGPDGPGLGHETTSITAWHSADRGLTWSAVQIAKGSNLHFPGVAVSPRDGTVYAYWNTGSKLMLAQSKNRGRTWRSIEVTPFAGRFTNLWATVGPNGDVALVFRGQATGAPQAYLYGQTWREQGTCARCRGAASTYARLDPAPGYPQEDFFQVEVSTDNAINVAFQDESNNLYFVRQTAGPGMRGRAFCGASGRP